jgi:hypothetical protein
LNSPFLFFTIFTQAHTFHKYTTYFLSSFPVLFGSSCDKCLNRISRSESSK